MANDGVRPMLVPLCIGDLPDAYRLMEQSFPKDEIRSIDGQRALFDDPRYTLLARRAADGETEGLLAVWDIGAFTFIEHFAVQPQLRGGGIGAAMLEALVCRQGKRICLEVEPPETEIARRRIGFYRRCGFTLNGYPYIMPSLEAGRQPLPLMIMTSGGAVDEAAFLQIRDALYTTVYHTAVPG